MHLPMQVKAAVCGLLDSHVESHRVKGFNSRREISQLKVEKEMEEV